MSSSRLQVADDGADGRPDRHPLDDDLLSTPTRAAHDELTALFRAMAPELFRYAARKIGPHEADDRVSDAFLVIWRRWDAAPSDHGERRAWVYGILKQTLRDHASTTVHRESRLARVAAWRRPVAEPLDRAVVDDAWINELLDALPVAQADAVRLAVLGGLTAREVAAQLGTTITSITTRIARARVALRAMIVSREEEE